MGEYFWKKKAIVSYVLAVFVMWSHCASFTYYELNLPLEIFAVFFKRVIAPVAVPLFFIMSGFLFFRDYSNEKYISKCKNRIRTLVIPFLLWNIFGMLFHIFTSTFFSQFFKVREKFEFSFTNIFLGIFHYKYNFPFWFIFSLILFAVFAPVISWLLSKKWSAVLTIGILWVLLFWGIGLPTPFFYNQTCLIYYLLGAFLGRYYCDICVRKANKTDLILSVSGVLIAWIYEFIIHLGSGAETANLMLEALVLIIYACSIWRIWDLIVDKIPAREIFGHSFWVYALHINVSSVVAKLLFFVLPKAAVWSVANFVFTTVLSLLIIELVCIMIKKFLPSFHPMLSGAR